MPSLLTLSGDSPGIAFNGAPNVKPSMPERVWKPRRFGRSTVGAPWAVSSVESSRAGPLRETLPEAADQNVLARLDLRPVFVGVERVIIAAAIEGEVGAVRNRLADVKSDEIGRPDRASGWVIPLGDTGRIVRDV